jgi:hypothetical protein
MATAMPTKNNPNAAVTHRSSVLRERPDASLLAIHSLLSQSDLQITEGCRNTFRWHSAVPIGETLMTRPAGAHLNQIRRTAMPYSD